MWADYAAIDVKRDSLEALREGLVERDQLRTNSAQALVRTPMPCSGLAECGVCAVTVRRGWKLACKDGPVLGLLEVLARQLSSLG